MGKEIFCYFCVARFDQEEETVWFPIEMLEAEDERASAGDGCPGCRRLLPWETTAWEILSHVKTVKKIPC